jgi:hypothetical protein
MGSNTYSRICGSKWSNASCDVNAPVAPAPGTPPDKDDDDIALELSP